MPRQNDDAPAPAPAPAIEPTPRPRSVEAIQADLATARANFDAMQKVVEAQKQRRDLIVSQHRIAEHRQSVDSVLRHMPFDPATCPGLLPIPDLATAETVRYHRLHYKLSELADELDGAMARLGKSRVED